MIPRVAILTEIPTPYRQPVFQKLALRKEIEADFYFLSATQRDRPWELGNLDLPRTTFFKGGEISLGSNHTLHLARGYRAALFSRPYDVYVIGGYAQPAMLDAIFYCWRRRIPYVTWTESHERKRRFPFLSSIKRPLLKRIYGRGGAHIVLGSASEKYVLQYGARPDRIFRFPNTIDAPSFASNVDHERSNRAALQSRFGLSTGTVLLFVGSLTKRKGIDLLVEAFFEIAALFPDISLLVVGTGPMETMLRERCLTHPSGNRVVFAGYIQPDRLVQAYAAADLFVLPSMEEPFGAVVCDAAAAGLPIAASDQVGAAVDFVRHGWNGEIFEAASLPSLVRSLTSLLSKRDRLMEMGKYSRELMAPWTHDHLADQLITAVRAAWSSYR